MPRIKFIKAHPVGIPVDAIRVVNKDLAERFIREEYAIYVEEQPESIESEQQPDEAKKTRKKKA